MTAPFSSSECGIHIIVAVTDEEAHCLLACGGIHRAQ